MPESRKLSVRNKGSSVTWFGFPISRGSNQSRLLIIGSVIGILASLFAMGIIGLSLIHALSMHSALQYTTGEYGSQSFIQSYGDTSIAITFISLGFWIFILCISIYTFNKMKQIRG